MPEFTPAQKQAIYTHGCNILVSAAAGSGKTAVLTERVHTMLCDEENPTDVDRLLVVTFTNAAAAEMKSRIRDKITSQLSSDISDRLRNHLQKQIALMGKAAITTIDSFCIDVVHNNFHLLDINPSFRVAEGGELSILAERAAKETIEEMYSGDSAPFFSEVVKWLGGNDDAFISAINRCYDFLQSFPEPMEQLECYEKMYFSDFLTGTEPIWCGYIKDYTKTLTDSCIEAINDIEKIVNENSIDGYAKGILDAHALLDEIKTACDASWDDFYKKIINIKFPPIGRKSGSDDPGFCEIVKDKYNKIKEAYGTSSKKRIIQKLIHQSFDEITDALVLAQPYIKMFCDTLRLFDKKFTEIKNEAGVVSFSDFEHIAYNILKNTENGVADSYRKKFKEIFVDEYQDCNQLQESMFRLMARKKDEKDCNMFMVGDIKQSIYRFRQADPSIFIEKNSTYTKADDLQRKITLNKNFRSSSLVLDAINDIFESVMNSITGEVEYNDDEKLYFRDDKKPDSEPKCEAILIDKNDTLDDIEGADSYEIEARVVANRILKLIDEGYSYSDIAVLTRSPKNMVGAFENEFRNRLIPYFIDYESGFFDGVEMRLFLSLVKITDNPMQDIPLTGVLRSKLFNFTDDELAKIRKFSKGLFYDALLKCSLSNDNLGKKCADFLNRLSTWQDSSIYMPVDEFLIYLANETSLYSYAALLPGGKQRKANIDFLVQQARSLMKSGFKGLYSFISHIDKVKDSGKSGSAKILSQNSNVVRVMSVHKSKGLEFPVVFLLDCERKFNKEDLKSNLFCDKELGFGVKFIDLQKHIKHPLISNIAASFEYSRKLISEEMRLLYVAMTRAKTKFICCGRYAKASEAVEIIKNGIGAKNEKLYVHEIINSNCYFDWILPFISDKWTIKAAQESDYCIDAETTETSILEFEEYSNAVSDILEYRYPFEKATELATKYSVSEIKKRDEFEDISSVKFYETSTKKIPAFAKETEKITATQAGTANHLVLSKIDYLEKSETEIYDFAKTLVAQGFLSQAELDVIDCGGISKFLSSSFAKRISLAKKVYQEFPFNMNMNSDILGDTSGETVLVQGIIDCMFEEDDCVVVVDFKTDKFLSEKSMLQYTKQLEIYSKAAMLLTGKSRCEKYLYMISHNKLISV